jgi:hypothetical protein
MQIKKWNKNRLNTRIETLGQWAERYPMWRRSRRGAARSLAAGNVREEVRQRRRLGENYTRRGGSRHAPRITGTIIKTPRALRAGGWSSGKSDDDASRAALAERQNENLVA